MPGSIRDVSITRGLLNRWDLVDPEREGFNDGDKFGDNRGFMARIGEFTASDGFGQGDDEAEEVFATCGVVEFADIFWGCDFFGWGLEVERRSDGGDFLGLRNWRQDYGLGVVWRKVQGRGSNGSVYRG